MLPLLISILGILITIFFVIGTHEAAHFIAARLLGVKVLRFSIGFGKTLFKWQDKKSTEYVIALIPLGGYVKMLDENEGHVAANELPYAFNRQPFYKKFLIVAAGPLANLFCAFVLYTLIFTYGIDSVRPLIGNVMPNSIAAQAGLTANQEIVKVDGHPTLAWPGVLFRVLIYYGNDTHIMMDARNTQGNITSHVLNLASWRMNELTPDPLSSLGIKPYEPALPLIIGMFSKDSPAKKSLVLNDKIIAINKQRIDNWETLMQIIEKHPNQTVIATIERQHKRLEIPVTIGMKYGFWLNKQGYLGIAPQIIVPNNYFVRIQYPFFAAIPQALKEMINFTYFNFVLFGKLITGKVSLQSLGGPITIFESAGDALHYGFLPFIGFLAFLSIAIGVINLLPIPGLDGGHLFIQIIEAIIRRPIPEKILLFAYRFGFILVLIVLAQSLFNDFLRL